MNTNNGNSKIPKGSWLDENGKRWVKVLFDVMADGGQRFVRQIQVILELHFDFSLGRYTIDTELGGAMAQEIVRQYPSLANIRNVTFVMTDKRVFNN